MPSTQHPGDRAREGKITVFSPTPLLTVTIESQAEGHPELHIHAGGQGFWTARMIARLGVDVVLCCPLGGDTGRLLRTLIAREDVHVEAIEIAGTSGSYVHDRRTGKRVEICSVPGSKLSRHEYDDLYNATFSTAMDSDITVLAGQYPSAVVPSDVYQRLAHDLCANGRPVLADLSGDDLEEALKSGVDLLCLSHEELVQNGLARSEEQGDLISGMESLHRKGASCIVLHRGAEPTLVYREDRLYDVVSPHVEPLDHRGGGDTFFAALSAGYAGRRQH